MDLETIYEEHWRLHPWEREFGQAVIEAEESLSLRARCLVVLAGCERWAWVLEFGDRTEDHRSVVSPLDFVHGLRSAGTGLDESARQAWRAIIDSVAIDEDDYLLYRLWWMLDSVCRALVGDELDAWGLSRELADMTSPSPLRPSFDLSHPSTRDDLLAWGVESRRRQWNSGTMPTERVAFLESIEVAGSKITSAQLAALRQRHRHWGQQLWNNGEILPWKPDTTPDSHPRSPNTKQ